jgi:hypothetical protein
MPTCHGEKQAHADAIRTKFFNRVPVSDIALIQIPGALHEALSPKSFLLPDQC